MLTRNLLLTALAATASCALAEPTGAAEATAVPKVIVATERSVEAPSFRAEIESYVREVNERALSTLSEDLRRELGRQSVVIGSNELRTRG
jgi:hypothetical protein